MRECHLSNGWVARLAKHGECSSFPPLLPALAQDFLLDFGNFLIIVHSVGCLSACLLGISAGLSDRPLGLHASQTTLGYPTPAHLLLSQSSHTGRCTTSPLYSSQTLGVTSDSSRSLPYPIHQQCMSKIYAGPVTAHGSRGSRLSLGTPLSGLDLCGSL